MNCTSIDLKAYFLDELEVQARHAAEEHLRACGACREELDRLRLTGTALRSLPEEEPARRIAFVSDKVFEPGWWQSLWRSGPRLGFASAAMLSLALVLHALYRPAAPAPAPAVDVAALEARVGAEVARQVEARLGEAVRVAVAQQEKKTAALLAEAERRAEFQRRADLVSFQENFGLLRKQLNRMYVASSELGGAR